MWNTLEIVALTIAAFGLVNAVIPIKYIGFSKRRDGVFVFVGFLVMAFAAGSLGDDARARKSGWESAADQRQAQAAGIETPQEWEAQRAAREAAEAQRRREQKAREDAEKAAADAKCLADLQCAGDKYAVDASINCAPLIERYARFELEWTNSWIEPKFSQFMWNSKSQGIIAYFGDKLKFQNGFGAWQNVAYKCIFDTRSSKVIEVTVWEGRL
ncbi:hypothetical protein [Roseospira goensis]|uniref:Uncharacterized protein n=1 Tax=Roseospira goensis TaxID=391922 RepID=A0A7W6S2S5_9PROT|nr:hypothetical protein [Roseospira goensis]MBB4287840.1 hypothetical protein [Roseospira goensis]